MTTLPIAQYPSAASLATALQEVAQGPAAEQIIDVAITNNGDFSGNAAQGNSIVYPPTGFSQLPTLYFPSGTQQNQWVSWSPNEEFLASAIALGPNIAIHQRQGTAFTLLPDPSTTVVGQANAVAWSPDSQFLAVAAGGGGTNTPPFTIYQRVGSTFTKVSDPSTPTSISTDHCCWSPNSQYVAFSHQSGISVSIWQRSGTTFTYVALQPQPTSAGPLMWSPDGRYLACSAASSAPMLMYKFDGVSFTNIPFPSTSFSANQLSWSPDSSMLTLGHSGSPFFTTFIRNGDIFTKLPDSATLPSQNARGVSWSHDGGTLAVFAGNPAILIYRRVGNLLTYSYTITLSGNARACDFSSSGRFLAVSFAQGTTQLGGYSSVFQAKSPPSSTGLLRMRGFKRAGA